MANHVRVNLAEKDMNEGKTGTRKVLVHLPLQLLSCIDHYAISTALSRTAVVRKACADFLLALPDGEGFRKPDLTEPAVKGVEITEPAAQTLEGYSE